MQESCPDALDATQVYTPKSFKKLCLYYVILSYITSRFSKTSDVKNRARSSRSDLVIFRLFDLFVVMEP